MKVKVLYEFICNHFSKFLRVPVTDISRSWILMSHENCFLNSVTNISDRRLFIKVDHVTAFMSHAVVFYIVVKIVYEQGNCELGKLLLNMLMKLHQVTDTNIIGV